MAELKGGIFGISSAGAESDAVATLALSRLGLTRTDVTIKEVGIGRLEALRVGEITAAMLDEPQRSEAFKAGLAPIIDFLTERVPWLYTSLAVERSYLRDNRETVHKFLAATRDGNRLAATDEARGKAVLAEALALTEAESVDICYENFRSFTPENCAIEMAGAENIIASVAPDTGTIPEDYIDTVLADALRTG